MAIQDNDGFWRGKKGDSVFRRLNDKKVVSQAPRPRKQTLSSIGSYSEFGFASNTAKAIRLALGIYYMGLDGGLPNRLNSAVRAALFRSPEAPTGKRDLHHADLSPLVGFQFNAHAPLNKIMKVRPIVEVRDGLALNVSLPAFSPAKEISYPKSPFHINCTARITRYAFNFRKAAYINMGSVEADLNQAPANGFHWNFDECMPAGCIVLACMSLHYHIQAGEGERKELNIREFSPAELIAAFHIPGPFVETDTNWEMQYVPLDGYRGNETLRNNDPCWSW